MSVKNNFFLLNRNSNFSYDSEEFKYFLAGFIEGEGSLGVSIKTQPKLANGFSLEPEFFVYHHKSGLPILQAAKDYFRMLYLFFLSM